MIFNLLSNAQVGIGTVTPESSAALEVKSNNKGLLTPRITKSNRINISNPATGLLVYQTNDDKGFYYFDGNIWQYLNCSGSSVSVGDYYMGGIVFYVEPNGLNGLIVALNDVGNGSWTYRGENRNTKASGLFSGRSNTGRLWSSMVRNCENYEHDNYSGWYLPSIGELEELNNNISLINTAISNNVGTPISNTIYWSSTEYNSNKAKAYEFHNNRSVNQDKNSGLIYRAIRTF